MNPKAKRMGAFISTELPHRVANQLNTLIPVGIAIIIVAAVKYALVSISNPTVVLNHIMDKGKTKWNRYREILASKDIKKIIM